MNRIPFCRFALLPVFMLAFSWVLPIQLKGEHSPTPKNAPAFEMHMQGFIENKGQMLNPEGKVSTDALFMFHAPGMRVFITSKGLAYQFQYLQNTDAVEGQADLRLHRMDMMLLGMHTPTSIRKEGQSKDFMNDLRAGIYDIRSYQKVVLASVYPNIDWVIYTEGDKVKYDFVVHPGGKPEQIRMQFKGHDALSLRTDGGLRAVCGMGEVEEHRPVSFQQGKEIATRFVLDGDVVGFAPAAYNLEHDLIIDPEVVWSRYFGGVDHERRTASMAVSQDGYIYYAANTNSDFLGLNGYSQRIKTSTSAFVVKFDSSGNRIWSTYIGTRDGNPDANTHVWSSSIALDPSGNVYVGGTIWRQQQYTYFSPLGLSTPGAHKSFPDFSSDGFLVKLNPQGQHVWGTFYGGLQFDKIWSVVCDAQHNVYFCGSTGSMSGIAQAGYINTFNSNSHEVAFLAKMDSAGVRQWGTYFYGTQVGFNSTIAQDLTCDSAGNIIMVGTTGHDSIATQGAYQTTRSGGLDGFMSVWSPTGNLVYATYMGGPHNEYVSRVKVDRNQDIYIAGTTYSKSGISLNGHQNAAGSATLNNTDHFLTKYNRNSGTPYWSTYVGGSGAEGVDWTLAGEHNLSLALSDSGAAYLAFMTNSFDSIAYRGFKNTRDSISWDIGIMAFSPQGMRIWGSYFGGNGSDMSPAIALDTHDHIYLGGLTGSTDIDTSGNTQSIGGIDGFIAKIKDCHISNSCVAADLPILVSDAINDTICPGGMVNLSVINSSLNSATHWQWYTGGCGGVPVDTGAQVTQFLGTGRTFYVRGEGGPLDPGPCDSIRIGTYAPITNNILSVNQQLCQPGVPLAITGTLPQGGNGVYTYIWRSATDINNFNIIPGATDRDYIPGIVSQTTYYRRQAISQCPNAVFSLNHAVEVQPFANTIGNAQVILYGTAPLSLTGTSQRPAPWFQWYASHDLNAWNPITGAVGADYQPGILSRTTYYRRNAGGLNGCDDIAGNIIMVEVVELLSQLVQVQSNSPVCQGSPVYLQTQAPIGATFAWTGPGDFSSSQQNPSISNIQTSQAGIYRLRVTLPDGDTIIHTHLIQVGSPLNVLTVGYNQPLCYGTKLDLSATALPYVNYSWQGPGAYTAVGATAMRPFDYQQSLQGVYSLVAVSPGCGSITRTLTVQVNTNTPGVRQSPASVCTATQFTLEATASGVAGFTWHGPNGFSTSQRSFVRTGNALSSGDYTLVQTIPGCAPATQVHTVFVAPHISQITSNTNSPICQNSDLSLSAVTLPGVQYQWTGPGGFISTQAHAINPMIDRTLAGNYILTMTYPGCFTQTRSHTVQVNNPFEAGLVISPAQACTGNQIVFSTSTLPNATYLWTGPNGFTSTQSYLVRNSANTSMAGVYTLRVTQPGCNPVEMQQSLSVTPSLSLLSVSPAQVVCAPASLSLSGANIPNAQMSWEGPNGFTASGSSFSIPVTQAHQGGTYRYRVQTDNCGTVFRNVNVTVRDTGALVMSAGRDTFCSGQVAYFSATPISGATYAWSGPAAFHSTLSSPARSNLQPQHSGTYSLQVQVPGCGTVNRTLDVYVQLSPANVNFSAVNLSGAPCVPATLSLEGTSVPGFDMRWTGPLGFTASGSSVTLPIFDVHQGGIYRYYLISNSCGFAFRNVQVSVTNPTPFFATSNIDTFCTGEVAYFVLSTNASGSTSWVGPGGYTSFHMNPSRSNLQPSHSGEYTVEMNIPGCGVRSSTVSIFVRSPVSSVTVPSSVGVCAPNPLNFSGSVLPGTHSWWQGPNGFTSSGANVMIPISHPNQTGTWRYHVSASRCWSTFRNLSVVVNTSGMPEGTISSPVCVSDPVYMQASFIAGATYQWQGPDGFVANTQNTSRSKATPLMAGMYTLSVTTPQCGTQTRELQLVVNNCRNGMQVEDILESESQASDLPALRVYPNPVTHTLYFEAGQQIEWIQLQDLQGRILSDYTLHQQSGHIDWPQHLSAGMYMAVFKSENGVQYRKIQKH